MELLLLPTHGSCKKLWWVLWKTIGWIIYEMNCHHHLSCIILWCMEKDSTSYMQNLLPDFLYDFNPILRVRSSFSSIIQAFYKEFHPSANYARDHGQLFHQWMKVYHQGTLLFNVEHILRSRDIFLEASLTIFWNILWLIEILDEWLKVPSHKTNVLQQSLWCFLSCLLTTFT